MLGKIAAIFVLVASACYDPSAADGLLCSPIGLCPDGQVCGADNVCRSESADEGQLAAPSGVTAIRGDRRATIAWDAGLGGVTHNIYMASQPGVTRETVLNLPDNRVFENVTSPYFVDALAVGTTYYFVVTSTKESSESVESLEASTTPGLFVYVADGDSGLQIIDVTDPRMPTIAGAYDTAGNARGRFEVAGRFAYVADGTGDGLQIIDVSDPANPTLASAFDIPGTAKAVTLIGNLAYVAHLDPSGLQIVDIRDPRAPVLTGSYATPNQARGVDVEGMYAYVADTDTLQILDVSNSATPTFVGSYDSPTLVVNVDVVGDFAYLADHSGGIQVVDVSNRAAPLERGSYDLPADATQSVFVIGNTAWLAYATSGLYAIDVSDPTTLTVVGSFDTPDTVWDVDVSGTIAYVADMTGLEILDISNPAAPVSLGSITTPDYAFGVALADSSR